MAGSYSHVVDVDDNFRGLELIDNLGDAHEALEEMYQMIQHLSGGDRRKIFEAHKSTVMKENQHLCVFEEYWEEE